MKYTIGLDLGTTSVGWAVVNSDKSRIEDLGVRLFESAENPKDGKSLAEPRRLARSMRRRLARRGYRLDRIKSIFVDAKLLTQDEIVTIHAKTNNSYQYRAEGLDRVLNNSELFIAVYHLAKRRGYKSNRKKAVEDGEDVKEKQNVLKGIRDNEHLLQSGGFRTVGEMLYKTLKDNEQTVSFDGVRNKPGSYKHSVSRIMLENELKKIIEAQKNFGNSSVDMVEKGLLEAFIFQRPYADGNRLKEMVGKCTFEKEERRAAKATYSFQYFNLLQKLNHLIIGNSNTGQDRPLTTEQKQTIIKNALEKKDINYEQIRKWLCLEKEDRFNLVSYIWKKSDQKIGTLEELEELKDACEKKTKFPSLANFYDIRKAICEADEEFWKKIKDNILIIDEVGEILTFYKTDDDILKHLRQIKLRGSDNIFPASVEDALLKLSFVKVGHLSLKALRKIIPYLEEGLSYDQAVIEADPQYRENHHVRDLKLRPIAKNDHSITNPVVRRTVAQTIKVVNAIIDKYGSPTKIHIELGRELSKDHGERIKILKSQEERKEINQEAVDFIKGEYNIPDPKGLDVVRYKLWREQNCKCAYSGKPIDEHRLFESGYTEIDHVIPFSRSFDDSYNNKVLVLTQENREKLNKLPYECFGHDENRWQEFQNLVTSMNLSPRKKDNLLLKKYLSDDLTTRTLNDTRYISKYLKNYIEQTLKFAESSTRRNVLTVNGMATAYLRKRWGLNKNREETAKHHAQDAVVVAVTDTALVQRVAQLSKIKAVQEYLKTHKSIPQVDATPEEIQNAKERNERNEKDRLPEPWRGFRDELIARMSSDPVRELGDIRNKLTGYKDQGDFKNIKPIFVSRMPRRKVTGQVHLETRRSPKGFAQETSSVRIPLINLKIKNLEEDGKLLDPLLYDALKKRLEQFNDDPKKAFAEPFYKRQKDGTPGPLVRAVKLTKTNQKSGILVNQGSALVDRSSMIRVDIFSKKNQRNKDEFFFVPVYAHHATTKQLPEKICTPGKRESDWDELNENFIFKFSLYPGDMVMMQRGNDQSFGYYRKAGISTAALTVAEHDNGKSTNAGIKTLDKLEKYVVDILGTYNKVNKETRQSFR